MLTAEKLDYEVMRRGKLPSALAQEVGDIVCPHCKNPVHDVVGRTCGYCYPLRKLWEESVTVADSLKKSVRPRL